MVRTLTRETLFALRDELFLEWIESQRPELLALITASRQSYEAERDRSRVAHDIWVVRGCRGPRPDGTTVPGERWNP